ncbi:MAG: hypothetical protein HY832_02400 [Candidatus Aenigmarchaeota archaeon]|nr:hypothetical protein [Candidatus Aenigmarchaeota archaeon]
MQPYNAAFFGLYENLFLVLKEHVGEEQALAFFREIMERGLKKSYDASGFTKGNPHDFARVVGERDGSVGLHVEFPEISEDRIIYQFHTDPFPNLRGHVDPKKLDDTYMAFKVRYLLGDDLTYQTTKHLWNGNSFTEHVISRKIKRQ